MKTQTPTKRATRRLAASLAIITALAAAQSAWAATDVNWGGGSGGSESAPLDVYDLSNWSGVSALSDAYNLTFDVDNVPTVLTNSCATAATTKIANGFNLNYGTWTLLGDYKFSSLDAKNSGTAPKVTTIVKKGDWELTYAAYLGRSGATTIITNVSGNIVQSGTSWFQIGNGNGGTAIVENLSGDWTIKGALELGHGSGSRGELYWRGGNLTQTYTANAFSLGWADNTSAVVEKYAGDWTTTGNMIVAKGKNSTASFKHEGGKLSVAGYFYTANGSNSEATVEKNGGDWTLNGIVYLGTATDSTSTLVQRGGSVTINKSGYALVLAQAANSVASVENVVGDWNITSGDLYSGWGTDSKATLDWQSGNLTVWRNCVVGQGANSEATLNWRGGDLTVGGYFYASQGSNSVATITKDAGDWTITGEVSLGRGSKNVTSTAATTFYHNGGSIVAEGYMDMTWENSCDFHMNGGEVYVANDIRFGQWHLASPEYANVYLNGGVLSAKSFRYHNGNKAVDNIVFDGGTFKAAASGDIATGDSSYATAANLRNRLGFKVGPKGGTIDTAGHDITNVVNFTRTSGSGGMRFVGGGSVVLTGTIGYTGKTSVEVGTTLEVTDASAKNTILNSRGLDIVGFATAGDYTVFTYEDGLDAATDLEKVTCSFAPDSTFDVVGNSIVCHYVPQVIEGNRWTGAANDGNLSTAGNWSDNQVPTSGNVLIAVSKPVTLTAGATFKPDTITIPDYSAVVTLADSLTLNTLTNAQRLAVAPTGSLTVTGDLVADGQGNFLYSNEGTVTVGRAVANNTTTVQYAVTTEGTQPIRTGGFLSDKRSGRVYYKMNGSWVVGADGFAFNNPENRWNSSFYVQNGSATLYSSADWTLANSGQSNANNGDHCVCDLSTYDGAASLTIDTSDYDESENTAKKHTVTLNGRIAAQGPVTIKGCGTVEVNTTGANANLPEDLKHTCITNGTTLAVTDTATLQVNAGRKITGNGTISLAAGTTLKLMTGADRRIPTFANLSLALPDEGTATIRIDGEKELRGDEYVLFNNVPAGYASRLNVAGTEKTLGGRSATLQEKDGKLVLDVQKTGLTVVFW